MGIQTWTAAAHLNLDNVYMLAGMLLILAPIGQQLNDLYTTLRKRHTLRAYDKLAKELTQDLHT